MPNYFLTKVNYISVNQETGKQEKVSQQNLIDAVTFTEAESCLNQEFQKDFSIDSIAHYKVSEIIDGGGDWYFKVKCILIIYDEEKGKEKRVKVPYLVKSDSVKLAEATFNEFMKGTMSDYEIAGVEQTQIDDVFTYTQNVTGSNTDAKLIIRDVSGSDIAICRNIENSREFERECVGSWHYDEDSETDMLGGQSEINDEKF